MKTTTSLIFFALLLALCGCNNFDDAAPTDRTSLIRFYSASKNVEGTIAEVDTDGGYIIAGNIVINEDQKDILIIKTDRFGKKLWEQVIKDGEVNSLSSIDQGYIIAGNRIQINRESSEISEIVNTQARFIFMNKDGTISAGNETIIQRTITVDGVELNVDYEANDVVLENGNLLVLASQKSPVSGSFQKTILLSTTIGSDEPLWIQDDYFLQDRDYVNCNSLQLAPNGNLLWATTTLLEQPGLSEQYLTIGYAPPNATFDNADSFGENDTRNHTANDFRPGTIGYAVVGTYAQNSGGLANTYFLRVSADGSIVEGSERYFDGTAASTDRDQSTTQDEGNAVVGTSDGGFVIAGTTETANGDDDILLIKLDAIGNLVWSRQIGGSEDETASSIRETPDRGLLICGTNEVRGQESMMLIKTDSNGNVEN